MSGLRYSAADNESDVRMSEFQVVVLRAAAGAGLTNAELVFALTGLLQGQAVDLLRIERDRP